jgi:general secretion pathway protein H
MPTSSKNKRASVAGFTLLELLVVLSIIAIATGLIIPNLAITDNNAFNAEVRRAASMLTYARRMAIVEGVPHTATLFVLDAQSPDYEELLDEVNAGERSARWSSELLQLSYQDELDPDPEPVDKLTLTFFPQGGSTGGLLAFSRNDREALIRVDPITGRITTAYNGEDLDEAQ